MNCFSNTFNSQSNPYQAQGDVGVGLFSKTETDLHNILLTRKSRPTLGVNQPSTTNVENTHISTFTKRVGLNYSANDFANGFHPYLSARPTPTFVTSDGGVL
jgi:hypothetical protein